MLLYLGDILVGRVFAATLSIMSCCIVRLFLVILTLLVSYWNGSAAVVEAAIVSREEHGLTDLQRISFVDIDGWHEDNHVEALQAFSNSCAVMRDRYPRVCEQASIIRRDVDIGLAVVREEDGDISAGVGQPLMMRARLFFENNFDAYLITSGGDGSDEKEGKKGLFTGYYVPLLRGSYRETERYKYPIYRLPPELAGQEDSPLYGSAQYSRKSIDEGALAGRGLEMLWLDDEVMRFFAHIQGSALVQLEDGSVTRISYAGRNGHEYVPIGRVLIEQGFMRAEDVSMPRLRQFLYDNPSMARMIMQQNPLYIFFEESRVGDDIAAVEIIGAQGVPLTAGRSLAVDSRYIGYGTPVFVSTEVPVGGGDAGKKNKSFKKLMIAQDTGSAIKGAVRGDIFFGIGEEAEFMAGNMKHMGEVILLFPKRH